MDTNKNTYDVVIPYKSSYPDTELYYSIKSLDNIQHGDIYLVGDKPSWYDGKHIRVTTMQWHVYKPVHNVENKIRTICEHPDLSEHFIFTNDDIFILKPTTIDPYHRGPLIDHIKSRTRRDSYRKSLIDTYEILRSMGFDNPLSYELHIPMIMNKQIRLNLSYRMEKHFNKGLSPLMRSVYGNLCINDAEYHEDVKNLSNYEGATFLSTNENTFRKDIGNYIRKVIT